MDYMNVANVELEGYKKTLDETMISCMKSAREVKYNEELLDAYRDKMEYIEFGFHILMETRKATKEIISEPCRVIIENDLFHKLYMAADKNSLRIVPFFKNRPYVIGNLEYFARMTIRAEGAVYDSVNDYTPLVVINKDRDTVCVGRLLSRIQFIDWQSRLDTGSYAVELVYNLYYNWHRYPDAGSVISGMSSLRDFIINERPVNNVLEKNASLHLLDNGALVVVI